MQENNEKKGFFSNIKEKIFGEKIVKTNITKEINKTNQKVTNKKINTQKETVTFLTSHKLDNLKKDNTDFEKIFGEKNFSQIDFEKLIKLKNKNEQYLFFASFSDFIKNSDNPKAINIYLKTLKLQNACPSQKEILKIREKYEKILFGNLKKKLEKYETIEGKNAFEELMKNKNKNFCDFDIIIFLSSLLDKNGKKINIEKILEININFLNLKNNSIESNFIKKEYSKKLLINDNNISNFLIGISSSKLKEKAVRNNMTENEIKELIELQKQSNSTNYALQNLSSKIKIETIIKAKKQNVSNEDLKIFIKNSDDIYKIQKDFVYNNDFQNILVNLGYNEKLDEITNNEILLTQIILELEQKENKNYKEIIFLKKLKEIKQKLEKIRKIENKYNLDQNLSEKLINTQYNDYRKNIIINEENFENTDDIINIIENSNLKQGQILNINFGKIKQNFNLEKINSGYKMVLGNSDFFCKNTKEIKEILNFGEYFSKLGLGFLLKDIEKILYFFRKKTLFKFNLKDGLNIKEHKKIQEILAFLLDIKDLDGDLGKKDEEIKDLGNSKTNYFYREAIKKDWFLRGEFRELEFEKKLENYKN